MNKRLFIALVLFLLLSTYNFQDKFNFSSKFRIKKILVENNSIIDETILKKKLLFLYDTNIFSINVKDINLKFAEIDFIESFELKKIYPDKIKIKIYERKPIAILQNKKEKKYYTNDDKLINFVELKDYQNLPIVLSDRNNFKIFYNQLKKINFPIEKIKQLIFFDSKRWDLITVDNKTIKLPNQNYEKSLKYFLDMKNQKNFEKYEIFDYRINNQLILK